MSQQYEVPPGTIVLTSHGSIRAETAMSITNMARLLERQGITNVTFEVVIKSLVDKARNEACSKLLKGPGQWIWFVDGDMLFEPSLALRMLETAFLTRADADVVGGYCQLRGAPFRPTIDRGSGTWESVDANVGILDVIRTGGACLLIKRKVLETIPEPWFGVRNQHAPLDILQDFDNYARQRFDGRNPFTAQPEWEQILHCARDEPRGHTSVTGEDSGFCDRVKAHGFTIVVDTHAVMGHIDTKVIRPEDHQEEVRKGRERERWIVGVA